ncbi:MAG: PBP1A family penicillin-binding protein [Bacteroidales bacterium]|nr:PBP1A family penicillin-binding protein [Bacteroidales bacterium]MCF8343024.1 PBP1A family penicillin-binding protein [Bacteroidales bacterium]MCF8350264.1 PBP1A family penicillin-binding protein [Bacteroidales bacterium]MCF8375996.1 PBP1A family penicillin-binding protein [Bacteroidales bacterium]MCF8400484.1 PBP1A family penicillin-binding protein [Bacteroidales bacterium]
MNKTKKKKAKKKYWSLTRKFWLIYAFVLLSAVMIFLLIGWFGNLPDFEKLENPEIYLASEIYSSDGEILGTYYIENRSNVQFRDLPKHLVNALIATEDIRYYEHSGIDLKALFRVAYGVMTGNHKGGGSTITQQLAKNLFERVPNPSTMKLVVTKLKEWITAARLERNYSKEEIIAMYFNEVSFGSQAYGIKAAAKTFFGKSPDSLNLQESALMVGVVNAPSRYNPVRNPERAFNRRNLVLSQMFKYGYISQEVYDSVKQSPIDMSNYMQADHRTGTATYFREYLRGQMKEWCKTHFKADGTPYNLYKDGLKIYSTINYKMQTYAEQAVDEHIGGYLQPAFFTHWEGYTHAPFVFKEDTEEEVEKIMQTSMKRSVRYRRMKEAGISKDSILKTFDTPVQMRVFSWEGDIDTVMTPLDSIRYYKYFLQAGLMSMEPHTGYVRAYVGGIDYRYWQYDHVTMAKRQVGSTFKPFLYTLAMQEGELTPCSKFPNTQPIIELPDGSTWEPANSSSRKKGEEITLKYALATSNNWISGHLINRYSPRAVIKIARKMGVKSHIPEVYSIALGSADLKLYEMVGAMNTFSNKGVYVEPIFITHIEDKHGNVVERFAPEKNEAMSEQTAYLMVELLKGVVSYGTGIRLRLTYNYHNPIAGKTGTTDDQSDGWFMGLTPDLTTGVWVGAEERSIHFRTLTMGQGANMALPIWAIYMNKVWEDQSLGISKGDFEKPVIGFQIETDCEKLEEENQGRFLIDDYEGEF